MGRSSDLRSRIVAGATPLFAARGYGSVSIAQIAATSGIDKGHVYYHFRYKEQLLDAIVSPLLDGLDAIGSARGVDRGDLVVRLVDVFFDYQSAVRVVLSDVASVMATDVGARAREVHSSTIRALAGPRPSIDLRARTSGAITLAAHEAAWHDPARPSTSARAATARAARLLVA